MQFVDFLSLIHPVLAIALVFPLIGLVVNFAWATRQRRLQVADGTKTKIPPQSGTEHLRLGRWLTGTVVGVNLLALAYSVVYGFNGFVDKQKKGELDTFQAIFIFAMFLVTIASLALLFRARQRLWRGIFATLTGMGLIIIGAQDGVWRMSDQWYWSHYYIGMVASFLMIFSLAIVEDIYRDRSHRWRVAHTVLNCIALALFFGQAMTGSRDLLEIPLSWQKPAIYRCDFTNKTCPEPKSLLPSIAPLS
jgi:drug/metabolite transporter (DMT)-like permease